MIQLNQLAFARTGLPLVTDATLQLHPGWRVGVIGANGCGKSTFFALLRGELQPEAGKLEIPAAWVVAHVAQETPALPDAALDYALAGDGELIRIEQELQEAEARHDGERIGLLHARLGEIGGYAAKARAAELLAGLGFSQDDMQRPVADFSGGWRMRLNLARALMCRSDLLLLDEPTNHLDLDAVLWLENWLRRYPGTLLVISHDRDFLDGLCTHVVHFDQGRMQLYTGGYSDFEVRRAERLSQQRALYDRQQTEIARLERFVERFRAKATKARQAQSRVKALERMERILCAHVDTPFTFSFRDLPAAPDPLLVLEGVAARYAGAEGQAPRTILSGVTLTLRPGERLALLGRNGAGKSTLIKLMAGAALGGIDPAAGHRQEGKGLVIGYFNQHQMERLDPAASPLMHLQRLDRAAREQDLRDFLGSFDFRGEMADAPCRPFSGGEKARLALALIVWQRPNLLLLDEPTNHLDLEMREALTLALQEYEGAVILVSHDRHLLRTTADVFWLVDGGAAQAFDGDLDDYAAWLSAQRNQEKAPDAGVTAAREQRREARVQAQAERQALLARRRPLAKELEKLERQMESWNGERRLLEQRLNDPALYNGPDAPQLPGLLKRQGELAQWIETGENRWLEIQGELDGLPLPD